MKRSRLNRRERLRRKVRQPPKPTTQLPKLGGDRLNLDPIVDNMRRAWGRHARGRRCAVCGYEGRHVEGHHALPLQTLKREVPAIAWYDLRIQVPLCSDPAPKRCHDRFELRVEGHGVNRGVILRAAPRSLEYAEEHGLVWLFDRLYPA